MLAVMQTGIAGALRSVGMPLCRDHFSLFSPKRRRVFVDPGIGKRLGGYKFRAREGTVTYGEETRAREIENYACGFAD